MAKQSYNEGNDKVIHTQTSKSDENKGTTHQQNIMAGEKGSGSHIHIYHERNDSTGRVKDGGHGENFKTRNNTPSSSESSGSGK